MRDCALHDNLLLDNLNSEFASLSSSSSPFVSFTYKVLDNDVVLLTLLASLALAHAPASAQPNVPAPAPAESEPSADSASPSNLRPVDNSGGSTVAIVCLSLLVAACIVAAFVLSFRKGQTYRQAHPAGSLAHHYNARRSDKTVPAAEGKAVSQHRFRDADEQRQADLQAKQV